MDKFVYTPAPWTTTRSNDSNYIEINGASWTALAKIPVRMDGEPYDDPEGVANCKIIRASPEMADFVRFIVEDLSISFHSYNYNTIREKARVIYDAL